MAGVKAILILILVASSALAGSVYDKLAGLDTEGGRLAQGFQKAPPIRVVLENRLPPVPAVENMINRPAYSTRALRAIHRLSQSLSAPAKSEFQEATPCSAPSSALALNFSPRRCRE